MNPGEMPLQLTASSHRSYARLHSSSPRQAQVTLEKRLGVRISCCGLTRDLEISPKTHGNRTSKRVKDGWGVFSCRHFMHGPLDAGRARPYANSPRARLD